jgi:NADPH:quinone reductase-like Zn-dependent oxidoreductase
MRGAGIDAAGGAVTGLELAAPRPLRADEVLLDVRAAGVANWDDLMRTGGWDPGLTPPFALGVEAAGRVAATGSEVTGFAAGDEVLAYVFPFRDGGAWAEQVIVPSAQLVPRPANVSWAQAAALPVPALTAQEVLDDALGLRAGEKLLVNGGSGVTGGMVVQFAALAGAEVAATAGPRSAQRVRALGAAHVIDYHDPDWPARAREALGGPAAAAVNAVPGGAASALAVVTDGGRLASIAGAVPDGPGRGIQVRSVYVQPDTAKLGRAAALLADGHLRLSIAAEYPLAGAADALSRVLAGTGGAAVALRVGDGQR